MKKEYEMNEEELTALYDEVMARHKQAKTAFAGAQTEEDRSAAREAYPNYQRGHMPRTPARKAFEQLKRQTLAYTDELNKKTIEQFEHVLLYSPDGPEYCYHLANYRQTRWPEAEFTIGKSAWWSYVYAKYVLRGRFPAGEAQISASPKYAERYERMLAIADNGGV
jgi:polyhydroxyalkanoate synthesis regulator phasin